MKSGCSGGPGLNAAAKVIFPARGDHRHRVGVLPTRRSRLSKRCVALPVARCPCSKNKWTYEPIEAADEPHPLPSVPTEATDLTDQTGIGKVVISIKGYVISIKGYACAHGCMPSTRTRAVARGRYATWTRTHASGCNACGAGSRRRPRCVRAASCVAL